MHTFNKASQEEMQQILLSDQFVLIPSDCEKEYKIHQGLLKFLSTVLHSTSVGGWAETGAGKHKFLASDNDDEAVVSENVVVCFMTWAYTGEYNTEVVGICAEGLKAVPTKYVRRMLRSLSPFYRSRPDEPEESDADLVDDETPDVGIMAAENLLLNVQMYVFAIIYLVKDLDHIALRKIRTYVGSFETHEMVDHSETYATMHEALWDVLEYACLHLSDDDRLLKWLAEYITGRINLFRAQRERWNTVTEKHDGNFARLIELWLIVRGESEPMDNAADKSQGEHKDKVWGFEWDPVNRRTRVLFERD